MIKQSLIENYEPQINSIIKNSIPKVLVLGSTGSGKSSFCNSLIADYDRKTFLESEKIDSFTTYTNSKKVFWFDKKEEFILIDTPGINDSNNNDTNNISGLVDHLKESIITLNAFIIVINGSNPRLDEPMKAMLKGFAEMFNVNFLKQTLIVFTRWPFDEKEKLRRKENNDCEEMRTNEINKKIGELLKFDTENYTIPCFYLCNSYNRVEIAKNSTELELKTFYKTLKSIKKLVLSFPIYYCDQIKKIKSEKDYLKQKLKEQEMRNFKHKVERGGCKVEGCDCLQYYYSNEQFKKYCAATLAATSSGGGLLGGFAGMLTGASLGGIFSGAMYFSYNICYCSHDLKDHYSPHEKNICLDELELKFKK
jgi:GTPase Era involved in 16S rRNA processing